MPASSVRAALLLCVPALTAGCGGGAAQPSAPTSLAIPSTGTCQAASGPGRLQLQVVNGSSCDSATSSVVLLTMRRADGGTSRCSGTVIGAQAVLTAAHCVSGNPIEVTVSVGGTTDISAQSFAVHPEYRPGPYSLDLAVVTTSRPIGRRAIPLLVTRTGRVGETSLIAGWGLDGIAGSSGLRAAAAAIDFVGDTFLTTRFTGGNTGTCLGDSGGPLLLPESGDWLLAGVASTLVSNTTADAPPCETGIGVYAGVRAATTTAFIRGLAADASLR